MNYEQKYMDANNKVATRFGTNVAKEIFTDLYESEDERIRKMIINHLTQERGSLSNDEAADAIAWLEKQGKQKPWSEEDEIGLGDALWAIEQARTITKDENDMGNLWYAERWLKSLKERIGG